jgi:multidrug efflux system outer membrane protein
MNRKFSAVVMALMCAGCAVGPDYVTPDTTLPQQFLGDQGQPTAEEISLEKWWSNFNDPILTQLVNDAVRGNNDLQSAIARVNQSRALYNQTFLNLFPTITSNGQYTNTHIPTSTFAGGAIQTGKSHINNDYFSTGFDAVWELDIFGRVRRSVEAQDAQIDAAVAGLQDAIRILVSEVARNYIELRGAQHQKEVAQDNARTQEQVVKVAEALFKGGQSTEFDVVRARAQYMNTMAAIPPFEAQEKGATYRLGVLTGRQPQELVSMLSTSGPLPTYSGPVKLGDPALLLKRRPDIRAIERQLAAATANIGVAQGDLFPKVTFNGSISLQAPSVPELTSGDNDAWNMIPTISWPAFNLGRVLAQVDQAEALTAEQLALYEQSILLALEETEGALARFAAAKQRRDYLKVSVDQSGKAVAIARTQYENGLIDLLPVLDAQRVALLAQVELVSSETNLLNSLVQLFKALGGGWDDVLTTNEVIDVIDETGHAPTVITTASAAH